ncbi:hypothetical protein GGS23DRAFT_586298 [Durotheca rogersii]|uniref:uncharacterized protein n=1 Tax=Durotheca rogersii TaxID=419775 RepID=UPI00221FD3E5|nr:uncharacterized protein GGS23DRAFT_586298 [Durotheca rogersii]KAI5859249.1 hypothetical protein GGS23DRAFT_586298 [Durotheca rogersii]
MPPLGAPVGGQGSPVPGAGPGCPPMTAPRENSSENENVASRSHTGSPDPVSSLSTQPKQEVPRFQSPPVSMPRGSGLKQDPIRLEDAPTALYSPSGSHRSMGFPWGRLQRSSTDSRSNLLNASSTQPAWRDPPPYSAAIPKPRKWWHWPRAWFMYLSFLFGVICAIGHHTFYKTLDGQPAEDQLSMLRYGSMLSLATKASLVSAVVMAFKRRMWSTVRSKFLSVAALDSLFAATEDLSAMLNLEIYQEAKIAMLLAVFVWITPVIMVLTSNTLTVEPTLQVDNTTCLGIRTLNFAREEFEEWRAPTKIDGLNGLSISLWNTTAYDTTSPNWFDYYTGATNSLIRVMTQAAFKGQAVSKMGINVDICGTGWNCTYTVNFTAPAYKCLEVASGVSSGILALGEQTPPQGFSTRLLVPEGDYSYYAYSGGGEYSPIQMKEMMDGGIPVADPPFPEALGSFRTEPVLWVGFSVRTEPDKAIPANRSMPGWNDAFIPKVVACEHYETDYTVMFNLTGGQQYINVTERKFLNRVMETTWIQGEDANDGTNDNTTAYPRSQYIYPRDVRRYRRVAAYHSMGLQLRNFLNGTINSKNLGTPIASTKADQTKLLDQRQNYFALPNMAELIPQFYEDMIFSLFSDQQFVSVVWAASPNVSSGTVPGDESTAYPCVRSRIENRYRYHERDLWIVYSISIVLAAAGVLSGTVAMLDNEGVLRSTRFSSIVTATRGLALEKLGWVADDHGELPQDFKDIKVGYGIIHATNGCHAVHEDTGYPGRPAGDAGEVRYGFGLEGDVRQLKRASTLLG